MQKGKPKIAKDLKKNILKENELKSSSGTFLLAKNNFWNKKKPVELAAL